MDKLKVPTVFDPDETLALKVAAAKMIYALAINTDNKQINEALEVALLLADTVLMFNQHLTQGGKLPKKWRRDKRTARARADADAGIELD